MRILHTSDWHLGHRLYGFDREEEHEDFFRQLVEIVSEHRPDALLISGDVYDSALPSARVQRAFTEALLRLHRACPEMEIVVTAGNHDSASRMEVDRSLWLSQRVHVIGNLTKDADRNLDFSRCLVRVGDKGVVAAIPYVNPLYLPAPEAQDDGAGDEPGGREEYMFRRLDDYIGSVCEDGLPAVMMAHLAVCGCDTRGHREGSVGNLDAHGAGIFGRRFGYVALGHIHAPQDIDTPSGLRIRYSGTPVAVSFDEDFPHSVTLAEVSADGVERLEEIEICPLRRLLTYPEVATDFKSALKALKKLDASGSPYVRLNVLAEAGESLPPDADERAAEAMPEGARYCTIRVERKRSDISADGETAMSLTADEFRGMTPGDIAERFFRSNGIGEERTGRLRGMVDGVVAEIERERRGED